MASSTPSSAHAPGPSQSKRSPASEEEGSAKKQRTTSTSPDGVGASSDQGHSNFFKNREVMLAQILDSRERFLKSDAKSENTDVIDNDDPQESK